MIALKALQPVNSALTAPLQSINIAIVELGKEKKRQPKTWGWGICTWVRLGEGASLYLNISDPDGKCHRVENRNGHRTWVLRM